MWFAGEGAGRSLTARSDDEDVGGGGACLSKEFTPESHPLCEVVPCGCPWVRAEGLLLG